MKRIWIHWGWAIVVLGFIGCGTADIRTAELIETGATEEAAERGRALLQRTAARHGLRTWNRYVTLEVVGVDYFPTGGWWPVPDQRLKMQMLLGTFTSRVELLNGPKQGVIWGIQAWHPYRQRHSGATVVYDSSRTERTARTFYLPTLQYFAELPFRLLHAEHVYYAGERMHRGRTYDLVLATWGSVEPNLEHDQYQLWIDRETGLIGICLYTLRDAGPIFTGTIHFGGYRKVEGVLFPFEQTVVLPKPENTLYPLDRYYFHRLVFEEVRFDTIDPAELLVDPTLETGDVKPDVGT